MTFRRALFAAAPLNTDTISHRGYDWAGGPAWPFLGTQAAGEGAAGSGGAGGAGQAATGATGGQQGGTGQQGQQGGAQFVAPKDQSEFDRMVGERLAREKAKYADYDELKNKAAEHDKTVEAQKTEAQKLADRAAAAEGKATETEKRALRAEIALEKGLTASQAKRLVGGTRDELVADADELLKDLGKPASGAGGQQATNFDQGRQGQTPAAKAGDAGRAEAQKRYGAKTGAGTTT